MLHNMLNMVKILEDGKIHTIQDLADELEVSTRMIRIYKQELEQAGIYIQGKQGINGGYILDNMKNTIDIGLTGEEIYQLKNMKKNELHRITKSYFRTCSTRRCRSQAPFCLCTLQMVSDHSAREPLSASDTLSEATAPVKLPA